MEVFHIRVQGFSKITTKLNFQTNLLSLNKYLKTSDTLNMVDLKTTTWKPVLRQIRKFFTLLEGFDNRVQGLTHLACPRMFHTIQSPCKCLYFSDTLDTVDELIVFLQQKIRCNHFHFLLIDILVYRHLNKPLSNSRLCIHRYYHRNLIQSYHKW